MQTDGVSVRMLKKRDRARRDIWVELVDAQSRMGNTTDTGVSHSSPAVTRLLGTLDIFFYFECMQGTSNTNYIMPVCESAYDPVDPNDPVLVTAVDAGRM